MKGGTHRPEVSWPAGRHPYQADRPQRAGKLNRFSRCQFSSGHTCRILIPKKSSVLWFFECFLSVFSCSSSWLLAAVTIVSCPTKTFPVPRGPDLPFFIQVWPQDNLYLPFLVRTYRRGAARGPSCRRLVPGGKHGGWRSRARTLCG